MTKTRQNIQLDCRRTQCEFHVEGGDCRATAPAITLNENNAAACWTHGASHDDIRELLSKHGASAVIIRDAYCIFHYDGMEVSVMDQQHRIVGMLYHIPKSEQEQDFIECEAPVLWHKGKKNEMKDYEYHWFTLHGNMKSAIEDMIKAIQTKHYDRYDILYCDD